MKNTWLKGFIIFVLILLGVFLALLKLDQISLIQRQMLLHPANFPLDDDNRFRHMISFNIATDESTIRADQRFLIELTDQLKGAIFHYRKDGLGEEMNDPTHWEVFVYQADYPSDSGIQGNPFIPVLNSSTIRDNPMSREFIRLLNPKYHGPSFDQYSFYSLDNLADHEIPSHLAFHIYYQEDHKLAEKLHKHFQERISILWQQENYFEDIHVPIELESLWVSLMLLGSLLIMRVTHSSREIAIGYIQGIGGFSYFCRVFLKDILLGGLSFAIGLFSAGLIFGRGFTSGAIVYYKSLLPILVFFGIGLLGLAIVFFIIILSFQRQMDGLVRTGISLRKYPALLSFFRVIGLIVLVPFLIQYYNQFRTLDDSLKYIDNHPEAEQYYGLYSMGFYSQPQVGVDNETLYRKDLERIRQLPEALSSHQPMHLSLNEILAAELGISEAPDYPFITVNHHFAAHFLSQIYPRNIDPQDIYFLHPTDIIPSSQAQMMNAFKPSVLSYESAVVIHDPLLRLTQAIENPVIWIMPDSMLEYSVFFPDTFFLPQTDQARLKQDLLALSVAPEKMFLDNTKRIEGLRHEKSSLKKRALLDLSFTLVSLFSLTIALIQMSCISQKKRIAVSAMLESPRRQVYARLFFLLLIGNIFSLVWLLTWQRELAGSGRLIIGTILLLSLFDIMTAVITIRRIEQNLLSTLLRQQGA